MSERRRRGFRVGDFAFERVCVFLRRGARVIDGDDAFALGVFEFRRQSLDLGSKSLRLGVVRRDGSEFFLRARLGVGGVGGGGARLDDALSQFGEFRLERRNLRGDVAHGAHLGRDGVDAADSLERGECGGFLLDERLEAARQRRGRRGGIDAVVAKPGEETRRPSAQFRHGTRAASVLGERGFLLGEFRRERRRLGARGVEVETRGVVRRGVDGGGFVALLRQRRSRRVELVANRVRLGASGGERLRRGRRGGFERRTRRRELFLARLQRAFGLGQLETKRLERIGVVRGFGDVALERDDRRVALGDERANLVEFAARLRRLRARRLEIVLRRRRRRGDAQKLGARSKTLRLDGVEFVPPRVRLLGQSRDARFERGEPSEERLLDARGGPTFVRRAAHRGRDATKDIPRDVQASVGDVRAFARRANLRRLGLEFLLERRDAASRRLLELGERRGGFRLGLHRRTNERVGVLGGFARQREGRLARLELRLARRERRAEIVHLAFVLGHLRGEFGDGGGTLLGGENRSRELGVERVDAILRRLLRLVRLGEVGDSLLARAFRHGEGLAERLRLGRVLGGGVERGARVDQIRLGLFERNLRASGAFRDERRFHLRRLARLARLARGLERALDVLRLLLVRALELGGSRLGGVERRLFRDDGGLGVGELGILLLARGGELFDLLAHRATRGGEFRAEVLDVEHEPVHVLLHVDGGGERHLEPRGFVFEFRLDLDDARSRRLRRRRGRRLGLARVANGSLSGGLGVARGFLARLELRASVGQFGGETFRLRSRRLRRRLRRLRLRLVVRGARGERLLALLRILEARLGIAERLGRLLELCAKRRGGFAGGAILLRHLAAKFGDFRLQVGNLRLEGRDVRRLGRQRARLGERHLLLREALFKRADGLGGLVGSSVLFRHLAAKFGDFRLQVGNLRLEGRDVRRLGRQRARLGERHLLLREALFQPLRFGVELGGLVLGLHLQTELGGFRVAKFLLERRAVRVPHRALAFQLLEPLELHLELRHLRAEFLGGAARLGALSLRLAEFLEERRFLRGEFLQPTNVFSERIRRRVRVALDHRRLNPDDALDLRGDEPQTPHRALFAQLVHLGDVHGLPRHRRARRHLLEFDVESRHRRRRLGNLAPFPGDVEVSARRGTLAVRLPRATNLRRVARDESARRVLGVGEPTILERLDLASQRLDVRLNALDGGVRYIFPRALLRAEIAQFRAASLELRLKLRAKRHAQTDADVHVLLGLVPERRGFLRLHLEKSFEAASRLLDVDV